MLKQYLLDSRVESGRQATQCSMFSAAEASRMAGSGAALRLHEFKEYQERQDSGSFKRQPGATLRVPRRGKDVRGLYPGQLGRIHVVHSQDHSRVRCASLDYSLGPYRDHYEDYPRSFDLQTFHALDVLRQSTSASQCSPETAYQEEFGLQSHLYPPDNTKFTLYSHPGPMQLRLKTE
ncbi:uncharacterized protein C1orf100 homolog isoform X1 [Coregonus clupeaformis]|uniref:Uncharacterized protein n=1 Tax=Coregonus suidteri TaxID=861788 RepID=A0AAN8QSU7_9TELE|nr:uncharacterized protein C1orf100 homolog isoform X1 [Coregonus clupeaformis]